MSWGWRVLEGGAEEGEWLLQREGTQEEAQTATVFHMWKCPASEMGFVLTNKRAWRVLFLLAAEFPDVHSQFMAALLKQDGPSLAVENWVSAQEGAGAWWLGRRLRGRAVVLPSVTHGGCGCGAASV